MSQQHLILTSLPNEIDKKLYVQGMVEGYLECALWTDEDLDDKTFEDIDTTSKINAINNCSLFLESINFETQGINAGQMGHDFWLTRNGHGAGFWDRGLGAFGERLTSLSKDFPTLTPTLGDDNKIHFE